MCVKELLLSVGTSLAMISYARSSLARGILSTIHASLSRRPWQKVESNSG
jgi:hypothetical protein